MRLPKELTTVTPLSKYLAMLVFITMPFIGFFYGTQYQQTLDLIAKQQMETNLLIRRAPTPTPTIDTKNWETYTSKDLGITFKYPPDYKISGSGESKDYISMMSPLNPNHDTRDYSLKNGELKIEIFLNDQLAKNWSNYSGYNKVLVGGVDTFHSKSGGAINDGEYFYINYKGKYFQINKFPLKTTRQVEFDQILSTFKFTQ